MLNRSGQNIKTQPSRENQISQGASTRLACLVSVIAKARYRSQSVVGLITLLFLILATSAAITADKQPTPDSKKASKDSTITPIDRTSAEFFENKVRPILVNRCQKCHHSKLDEPKGDLTLDSRGAVLEGGDSGPAVVPGKPEKSMLIDAINYRGDYEMPPKSKMPKSEISILEKWVKMGVPWPKHLEQTSTPKKKLFDIQLRRSRHWAWQPIRKHQQPTVKQSAWPKQSLDYFILQKLEEKRITPSPAATRRALIRRVYFDLIGLPPKPSAVQEFVDDQSPQAFEKVVDRLLKSPRFGERWGRHWLDLVRYAETRGHEFDHLAPNAYQYRDYVIRALNADLPYDQFLTEQIAGDLIKPARLHPTEGFNESILGTGFWFLGEAVHSPVDIRGDEADRMANQIDVFGKTFLGLTIACARCHDHKFDAIAAKDYAAIGGYLTSSTYRQVRFDSLPHNEKIAQQLDALETQYRKKFAAKLVAANQPMLKKIKTYLLASREVLCTQGFKTTDITAVKPIAKKHQIDADLLANWVNHLVNQNQKGQHSPLRLWAKLANRQCDQYDSKQLKQLIINELSNPKTVNSKKRTDLELVVDYANLEKEDWRTNSFAFGLQPLKAGELLLTGDVNPAMGISLYGKANRQQAFNVLQLTKGTQLDPGRLAAYKKLSQAIRTPSFVINKKIVYVLIQGTAQVYAVVDSHRMNAGPLHGRLLASGNAAKDNKAYWLALNLQRYHKHRVHLEIIPKDAHPLSVLKVVQADRTPPYPTLPKSIQADQFSQQPLISMNLIAEEIAKSIQQSQVSFAKQSYSSNREVAIADWMLKNRQLFTTSEISADREYQRLAAEFIKKRKAIIAQIKTHSRTAMAIWDGNSMDEFLLIRGNASTPSKQVPRRILIALGGNHQPTIKTGSGRLQLAKKMLSPENPYVARVMINRIWHHLMGRGIVPTVDNFGVLGMKPTHPQLLDQLATEFLEDKWSMKRAIRRIVLSSTYQMASRSTDAAEKKDPANQRWHRMPIRRLEGEVIRDAILLNSGRLDLKMFGPSVPVHLTSFMEGRGRPGSGPLDGNGRRSIYIKVQRNFLSPMMLAFDTPSPFNTVGRRTSSNVPAQALILLNDEFIEQQAMLWAKQIVSDKRTNQQQRINGLYLKCFSRPIKPEELTAAQDFLKSQAEFYGIKPNAIKNDVQLWKDLCQVMWNVKEFIFIK